MFERKKMILNWMNIEDYISIAGYSEIEKIKGIKDTYENLLKRIIANREKILELTDDENPTPDAKLEKDSPACTDYNDYLNSPIFIPYSKRKQLFEADQAIYRLSEIVDYYKSIEVQDSKASEYVQKYENDYEFLYKISSMYNDAVSNRKDFHCHDKYPFQSWLLKYAEECEIDLFSLAHDYYDGLIKADDDLDDCLCQILNITREQLVACRNFPADKKMMELNEADKGNGEEFPESCIKELVNPRIIIDELTKIIRKSEQVFIKEFIGMGYFFRDSPYIKNLPLSSVEECFNIYMRKPVDL